MIAFIDYSEGRFRLRSSGLSERSPTQPSMEMSMEVWSSYQDAEAMCRMWQGMIRQADEDWREDFDYRRKV